MVYHGTYDDDDTRAHSSSIGQSGYRGHHFIRDVSKVFILGTIFFKECLTKVEQDPFDLINERPRSVPLHAQYVHISLHLCVLFILIFIVFGA